ncbi:hypothetical protein CWO91_18385 [Bradyrhizobium genosp. SA-3]|uniref:hypothetical protein n=1 Tax=Bradyrhizobium genosp. SA-3 TaxID=508868 RepID=UPI00102A1A0D|nr:hypothetical protein [Bradyrhizobium genosp. SA-3]RZN09241.1 hypothetical protein CWO91_18385 [Bradyrhizobium genosp. SA-3]
MSTAQSTSGQTGDFGSLSIRAIVLSLKPGQLWALLGVMAVLLFGSFSLGSFIATLRKDLEVNEAKGVVAKFERDKELAIAKKDLEINDAKIAAAKTERDNEVIIAKKDLEINEAKGLAARLEKDKQHLNETLDQAKGLLDTQKFQLQQLVLKSDFLHRYYSYVVSNENPGEVKLFSDVVCILWKRSQEARLNIRPDTVFLTPSALRRGLDQATKDELTKHGINYDEIVKDLRDLDTQVQRTTKSPRIYGPSSAAWELARKEHQSKEYSIADKLRSVPPRKLITFSEVTYEVPQRVAEVVHNRNDCAPSDRL